MKKFLDVFKEPKKDEVRAKFERALEQKIDQSMKMVSFTEPDKHDHSMKAPKQKNRDQEMPVVQMLGPQTKLQLGAPVHEQARTRDFLISEGAYRKLIIDKNLQ